MKTGPFERGITMFGVGLGLVGLALFAGRPAAATTATLAGDTFSISSAASANKGKSKTLDVAGAPDSTVTKSAFVQFDLSTLPGGTTGANVAKATLRVFVKSVAKTGDGSFDVVRVTSAWDEATMTTSSAPTLGTTEVSAVPVAVADKNEFIDVDVTSLVKDWLDGALTNNGLALVANGVDGLNAKFDSKESTANSQVPRLEITLAAGGGTVTNVSAASPLSVTNPTTTPNLTLGTVPITKGGTGAITASAARSGLGAAASGANSDITSIGGLTTPLSIAQGGTGATDAGTARANISAAASGSNSDIAELNSLTGNIVMPNSTSAFAGNIYKGGFPFMHNYGNTSNTFLGQIAGNFSSAGTSSDTGVGYGALRALTSGVSNTAVGSSALRFNTSGGNNTAVGATALNNNTTASDNTAVGVEALKSNTTGPNNTAVGRSALIANTTGDGNTGLGRSALASNTTGFQNTATGYSALGSNVDGTRNVAVGGQALGANTSGLSNTAVGEESLLANTSGWYNTAVGQSALQSNTTASENTAVGREAMRSNTTGTYNTAVGLNALWANTTASANTALGRGAMASNTTGAGNTAVGANALAANTTTSNNTAVGRNALLVSASTNPNTAVGSSALSSNSTGYENTALGYSALALNTDGFQNTALGELTLVNNVSGFQNVAVGMSTLYSNTGNGNTAVGAVAMGANTTGDGNTAVGHSVLRNNTTGSYNVAVGDYALVSNTTGNYNTAIGDAALYDAGAGEGNVALGRFAGRYLTGSFNTVIGAYAGVNLTTGHSNIIVGNPGFPGDGGTIRIGQSGAQTRAFIQGVRGVTTGFFDAIPVLIDSQGQLGTVSSSRRFKTDIHDMGDASSKLLQLRPVTFRYRAELDPSQTRTYGLIAEEVAEVMPDLVAHDKDGNIETVKYQLLSVMLLNELQKQQRQIATQAQQVAAQAQLIGELQTRLVALEAAVSPPTAQPAAHHRAERWQ